MIYGVGTDICDVRRIRASLARHGDRFARKILSDAELAIWRAHIETNSKIAGGKNIGKWSYQENGVAGIGKTHTGVAQSAGTSDIANQGATGTIATVVDGFAVVKGKVGFEFV